MCSVAESEIINKHKKPDEREEQWVDKNNRLVESPIEATMAREEEWSEKWNRNDKNASKVAEAIRLTKQLAKQQGHREANEPQSSKRMT